MGTKSSGAKVETFADHQIITPPNRLRHAVRKITDKDRDDPVARAEQALANISSEFADWMGVECDRLSQAYADAIKAGYAGEACQSLFRAAHDIKGDAATLGFPTAAAAAESLCLIIEHAPDLSKVPSDLVGHHVRAIQAIVREQPHLASTIAAEEISMRLRKLADDYLARVSPVPGDQLSTVAAPNIAPL
jgi:chemotaxis protein histidine kinase CheA